MRKTVENIGESENELIFENKGAIYRGTRRRVRKGDIIAFILSVFAAIFLWFYVMAVESPNTEMDFQGVTVEVEGEYEMRADKGWSLISTDSRTVDLILRGKKSLLGRMKSDDIHAFVDLSKVEVSGRTELPVEFSLPEGVTCISEKSLQVEVDELVETRVPVEPVLTNYSTGSEYMLGDFLCSMKEITVSGPAREVEKVVKARAIVDMENKVISDSFSATVTPVLCDENNHSVSSDSLRFNADTVTVTVPVYLFKTVDLTVTYKHGYFNDRNVSLEIEPASVRIYGDPAQIAKIHSISLVEIDETTVTGDLLSNYNIPLPNGVTAADGSQTAKVVLTHIGTTVRTVTVRDISVTGGERLNYRIVEPSIDVSLRCGTEFAKTLSPADISASIDLGTVVDSQEGTIKKAVTVTVTGAAVGQAYVLGQYSVTVEILPPVSSADAAGQT